MKRQLHALVCVDDTSDAVTNDEYNDNEGEGDEEDAGADPAGTV